MVWSWSLSRRIMPEFHKCRSLLYPENAKYPKNATSKIRGTGT